MGSFLWLLSAALCVPAAGQCYRKDLAPEHKAEYVKTAQPHTYTTVDQLPSVFTWQNVNGMSWLTPLLNQHIPVYCGGCWLHGSIAVLNDRLKIARNGTTPDIMLARQTILNCGTDQSSDHYAGSCQGGTDKGVYHYMMKEGLPDETCQQYDATDHECSPLRTCMNCDNAKSLKPGQPMCYPVTRYGKFFASEWGPVPDISVHNMKAEIFRRGPITCSVDSGRLEEGRYQRGEIIADTVRSWDGKAWEIDHIVSIVGWGTEAGVEYWIVRNSWGRYWGEDGFVKVATGKNVMSIETDCNWVVIGSEPITENYGPSDADRLFPSEDVSPLTAEGYQQALASKFQADDVATFIRRLVKSHDWTLAYDSRTIYGLAASPPALFSDLLEAVQEASCGGDSGSSCDFSGVFERRPFFAVVGVVSLIMALSVVVVSFVCIMGKRRLCRDSARDVPRAPLAPAHVTEIA